MPETRCQYYVLSPRPSLSPKPSPRPSVEGNENIDANARSTHEAKGAAKCVKKVPSQRSNQLSTRPSTPQRTGRDTEGVLTPRAGRVTRSLPLTPDRDECGTSVAELSVCSGMSRESRLSQLSRKTNLRRHLSSKELEEMQVEQKRRQVQDMIRRNEVSCRKALNASDASTAGRVATRPTKMTVPKEFNFAAPPTPRTPSRSNSVNSVKSDRGEYARSPSVRSRGAAPASARKATPTKQWRPQLTVPRGPALHTSSRTSTSDSRRSLSCPPEDLGSEGEVSVQEPRKEKPVRARTPESRKLEVYAAASQAERRAAAARAAAASATASRTAARRAAEDRGPATARSSKKPGAEEKADLAKRQADLARRRAFEMKDEESRATQAMMQLFKKPEASAEKPRPRVNPPSDWDGAGEMSVCSTRSARSTSSSTLDGRPRSARGPVPRPSFGSSATRPCLA